MIRRILFLVIVLSAGSFAAETTIQGYLMDVSCSTRKVQKPGATAKHSKSCLMMPACQDSGYGVLTPDGQFIKFDQQGNEQARKFVSGLSKETNIQVAITGNRDGGKISVSKIILQ